MKPATFGLFVILAATPVAIARAAADAAPYSNRTIAEAQWALDVAGAHIDVNGDWGPSTETALRGYQQALGLPVTGRLDRVTRSWLHLNA
jgi:peptidoglycan hydrolase-like protein with peptidoglycan-binding domain